MKKQTRIIILLSIAMGLVFAGLLYIQIRYIKDTIKLRQDQFNEVVGRSLSDVVKSLEEMEADRYLNKFLLNENRNRQKPSVHISHQIFTITKKDSTGSGIFFEYNTSINSNNSQFYISGNRSSNTIASTTNLLQERLRDQFIHQNLLLDNAALRWLKETSEMPIQERLDFVELDSMLRTTLANNGLNLPYHFSIVDREKVEVFRSEGFENTEKQLVFEQRLFPYEQSKNSNFLRLYFP